MADRQAMLAAFADPTRQAVLNLLRRRALTVGELAERLPVSRPAVSQHLQVLKSAGLVEEERQGTQHFFRLNAASLADLRSLVDSLWQDALTAFSNLVEKENSNRDRRKQNNRANRSQRVGRLPRR
jgi:DNA-binding transcriptional ArsR family regulator